MGVVISLDDGKHRDASVKPLVENTRADMERVNQLILSKAGSDVAMIPEVANHLISSGGKRLRPMLTLASATMFGYSGESHIKLATAVEFMHTATLLHDDVVDESDLRRGRSTARMIWGNQASVLVGDFLLGQAFKMMVEVGSLEALDVLSTAASVIAEGEVLQLSVAKNMKVGNLEDKFEEEFGLKVQVAGSDDSYLSNDNLTLNAARILYSLGSANFAYDHFRLSKPTLSSLFACVSTQSNKTENLESATTNFASFLRNLPVRVINDTVILCNA